MSRKAEILRSIVKKNPEPARGKSGTDPLDPWNAKSGLAEASEQELLHRYLKSRGINPDYIPKDTKIAHSKSSAFLSWRRAHEFDESVNLEETVDKEDTITFDIPLLIRMFEYAREDAKTDMDLHKVTEKLISIRDKGTLTMADYDFIVKLKEDFNLDEGAFKSIATDAAETKRLNKMTTLDKFRADATAREKKHDTIAKNSGGMTSAIDRLEKHLNKEEVEQLDEISKETLASYRDKAMASNKNAKKNRDAAEPGKDMSKGFADLHAKSNAIVKKRIKGLSGYLQRKHGMKPGYEDERKQTAENTLDPKAATEAPVGPGECGCDSTPAKERSKSARIIKSIYKRKNMKEETYDWEKDDKAQSYGKKPKISNISGQENMDQKKPDARIVMSGGKTMTGDKRDTVEVDPLMNRPSSNQPDYFEKPTSKKDH